MAKNRLFDTSFCVGRFRNTFAADKNRSQMTAIMQKLPASDFLHVRFPAPVLNALRELAEEEGYTLSQITRRLIAEELKRNGKKITYTINLL